MKAFKSSLQPCCWLVAEGMPKPGCLFLQAGRGACCCCRTPGCSSVGASSVIPWEAAQPSPAAPFRGSLLLSASLGGQCSLPLSGHQAAACAFSGHSLLNCVAIERNTITLRDSRAIVNTCSLPSCSILAWSVSLERAGKASLGRE